MNHAVLSMLRLKNIDAQLVVSVFFVHSKLELLTKFPVSKEFIFMKIALFNLNYLMNWIMGLRPLQIFESFSAEIDFRRQNLTSIDVRF